MAQITIYLDKELEEQMRAYAKSLHISQSKWIAGLIREKLQSEWPASIHELAGAWKTFPSAEDIRAELGQDVEREQF
ncbi:MAG: CopG family transcriptional regulator [Chloroflexi bacterium]|nr:CopG family transcriptional regulator [Chloroflexota bacterium]